MRRRRLLRSPGSTQSIALDEYVPAAAADTPRYKLDSEKHRVSPAFVLLRILTWSFALLSMARHMVLDRILRRSGVARDAVRLRETLEKLGPSAIKIGQQLSIRTDLIPREYSDELMRLLDDVPPFSRDVARRSVEQQLRRPLEALFRNFSETPIGSASIACVYKAQLHSGEIVAVKIRRPEVARVLVGDLSAISFFFRMAERVGLVGRGRSRPVVDEFRRMLLDELNFLLEARQTELFREDARKANPYVTAPMVYWDLSTSSVLVTEFIDGIFLRQILDAIQRDDQSYLADLQTDGYNLQLISRRLMNVFYWQLFENTFFHADPHPSNVVLQPDGKIVLIDFGATGTITSKYRKDLMNFVRSLVRGDIDGMVRNMINSLKPLPPLNLDAYTNEMYDAMREYLFTARSKHSTWQERSSGRAMMTLSEISRKYKIPMRADVLRYMRASFQFDSIVYRLNPGLDSRREFRRYMQQRVKRGRKQLTRNWKQARQVGLLGTLQMAAGGLQERLSEVDSVLSFLAKHTIQLESLFRRGVSARMRILTWLLTFIRVAGAGAFTLVLWTWCRQHHPLWPLCHALNTALSYCFGPEARYLPDQIPLLSQRLWFWISISLFIIVFTLGSLIRSVRKPRSKLE
jgi:ubiquinone biosynthesis protein